MKHDAEICAMKKELQQLKMLILHVGNQVEFLNQEIQAQKQTNIAEFVQIVVSMLEKAKDSEKPPEASEKDITSLPCDHCEVKCDSEELLIKHMSREHDNCPSCDMCRTYFGNKLLLKAHNKIMHTEIDIESESEQEEGVLKVIEEEKKTKKKKRKSKK